VRFEGCVAKTIRSPAVFTSDSEYVATASWDGTSRIGHWRTEDLIADAGARLSRNLTQEEWHHYLGGEPYAKTYINLLRRSLAQLLMASAEFRINTIARFLHALCRFVLPKADVTSNRGRSGISENADFETPFGRP
jgi:hypothetical protein